MEGVSGLRRRQRTPDQTSLSMPRGSSVEAVASGLRRRPGKQHSLVQQSLKRPWAEAVALVQRHRPARTIQLFRLGKSSQTPLPGPQEPRATTSGYSFSFASSSVFRVAAKTRRTITAAGGPGTSYAVLLAKPSRTGLASFCGPSKGRPKREPSRVISQRLSTKHHGASRGAVSNPVGD